MSSDPPKGYIPIVPEYKWARHSEEIADRNSSVGSSRRPASRELGYNGFPTTAEGWQSSQKQASNERTGRTRHRPNRSIDVLDYARMRNSQDLSESGHSRNTSNVTAQVANGQNTASPSSRFSEDTSASARAPAGASERPVSRGGRLRHYASTIARWPMENHNPLFASRRERRTSNTSQDRLPSNKGPATQRPATSHVRVLAGGEHDAASEGLASGDVRLRSHSLDAKRTLHFDRQRQSPPPPRQSPPPPVPQMSELSIRPKTSRPSSQADIVVPARSSSLGPRLSVTRKPVNSDHHQQHGSMDATTVPQPQLMPSASSQTAAQKYPAASSAQPPPSAAQVAAAKAAGINLSNTVQTHQHTTVAPAVTQEIIKPHVHEIRTERITRDIHNTHIVHRVLPIKQTEHLPARHFVRSTSGNLQEVNETDVPHILGFA